VRVRVRVCVFICNVSNVHFYNSLHFSQCESFRFEVFLIYVIKIIKREQVQAMYCLASGVISYIVSTSNR